MTKEVLLSLQSLWILQNWPVTLYIMLQFNGWKRECCHQCVHTLNATSALLNSKSFYFNKMHTHRYMYVPTYNNLYSTNQWHRKFFQIGRGYSSYQDTFLWKKFTFLCSKSKTRGLQPTKVFSATLIIIHYY